MVGRLCGVLNKGWVDYQRSATINTDRSEIWIVLWEVWTDKVWTEETIWYEIHFEAIILTWAWHEAKRREPHPISSHRGAPFCVWLNNGGSNSRGSARYNFLYSLVVLRFLGTAGYCRFAKYADACRHLLQPSTVQLLSSHNENKWHIRLALFTYHAAGVGLYNKKGREGWKRELHGQIAMLDSCGRFALSKRKKEFVGVEYVLYVCFRCSDLIWYDWSACAWEGARNIECTCTFSTVDRKGLSCPCVNRRFFGLPRLGSRGLGLRFIPMGRGKKGFYGYLMVIVCCHWAWACLGVPSGAPRAVLI